MMYNVARKQAQQMQTFGEIDSRLVSCGCRVNMKILTGNTHVHMILLLIDHD